MPRVFSDGGQGISEFHLETVGDLRAGFLLIIGKDLVEILLNKRVEGEFSAHYKVTDKQSENSLAQARGGRQVVPHETGTMVGAMAGFGSEAGNLPLHLAGGGPAFRLRRAGMRGVPDVSADV